MSDKGSDNGAGAGGAVGGGPSFTERELQLLSFAMRSLKSGPPEVSRLVDIHAHLAHQLTCPR